MANQNAKKNQESYTEEKGTDEQLLVRAEALRD